MLALEVVCNKDCTQCNHLNILADDNGYPFAYECMKFRDSVFQEIFKILKNSNNLNRYCNM